MNPYLPVASSSRPGFHKLELNKTFWDVPIRYQDLVSIGSGAYGQVCSARDVQAPADAQKLAIKKLARPFQSAIHAKRAFREIKMLKHMHHENVISLLDLFTPSTKPDETFEDVYLVTPLMGADLNNIVKTQKLSDDHVQFLVYQILRGLKYIHSAGVLHRDLKPSNIAVNEDCELKILDFGLARLTDAEMTGYVATRWYRAPEIMLNWMHYNKNVDVWSVGCIMAELLTGKPLFPGTDHIDQLKKTMALTGTPNATLLAKITSEEAKRFIKSLPVMEKKNFNEYFKGHNPEAINLLEKMLDLDPDTRISVEDALVHPYLAHYSDPEDEPVSELLDQAFEDQSLDVPAWKNLIFAEIENFTPPLRHEPMDDN
ncbi:hypothetical protein HELRODRAFT_106175 [Helobdella robusta]|uniref:mitogen-activated protein kinase n=1 Tax=Helobdella robusta TaxID=6412 RepID=T1EE07_HELRO|nr:hypothetical protein HELRODRAFT_106175 [Helobdella robusta]ESO06544.1 hypothetical protein HELRODRAFT_106175 [Helobdella robusta]